MLDCLFFLRYWLICVLQLLVNQFVTSDFEINLIFLRHSLKSGPETQGVGPWDPRHGILRHWCLGPWNPETLRPGTLGSWHPGPWNWDLGTWGPDTQDSATGSLGLGTWDSEIQNPESRTLRIELATQIPSIPTHTTDWVNFNYEGNFDNKKLGRLTSESKIEVLD